MIFTAYIRNQYSPEYLMLYTLLKIFKRKEDLILWRLVGLSTKLSTIFLYKHEKLE